MTLKIKRRIKHVVINIGKKVGKGYKSFWVFRGRYRVVKGSRASKKSKTAALWYMYHLSNPKYSEANLLVVRKVFRTLKDSCFTDLKWAAKRLGVDYMWDFKESPLEATNRVTGQKILFRGLDDPLKITSITVEHGYLCWGWLEEAYEVMKEEDFDILDESIRGEIPEPLFKQWTITFNPWNARHWLKHKFFDEYIGRDSEGKAIYKERAGDVSDDGQIFAITTNYLCNEWLGKDDHMLFERMKKNNPKRYQVAGLGNWGNVEGCIYEKWREEAFDLKAIQEKYSLVSAFGLDFGYTNDPTALFVGFVDLKNLKIYVWDEMYKKGLSNKAIASEIKEMGYGKETITADSSEPKSIDELHRSLGLRIKGAKKGPDSIIHGIQFIQDFELIIHPRCVNFLTEITNYTWDKDKFGKTLNVPIDSFNHLMDAMRYAVEDITAPGKWLY